MLFCKEECYHPKTPGLSKYLSNYLTSGHHLHLQEWNSSFQMTDWRPQAQHQNRCVLLLFPQIDFSMLFVGVLSLSRFPPSWDKRMTLTLTIPFTDKRQLTWMFCCIFFFSACRCWHRSSSSSTLASRSWQISSNSCFLAVRRALISSASAQSSVSACNCSCSCIFSAISYIGHKARNKTSSSLPKHLAICVKWSYVLLCSR